jgi:glycosyltransferase involved in cell wall biosynthesis
MKPLVSIICPYRDAEKFLPQLISNVRAQVFQHWELLLIDDASKDSGPSLAQAEARQDSRICALSAIPRQSQERAGPWWPRNQGLQRAQGEWIAFLDADDLWHPLKLAHQLQATAEHAVDLCMTGYARFDDASHAILSWRCPPTQCSYQTILRGNDIPMLTVMVRRELLARGFEPADHEDYLLWLNLFRDHPDLRLAVIPELMAFYRIHDQNLTTKRWTMAVWTWNVYRAHGFSRFRSLTGLMPWAIHKLRLAFINRQHPLRLSVDVCLLADTPLVLPPPLPGKLTPLKQDGFHQRYI